MAPRFPRHAHFMYPAGSFIPLPLGDHKYVSYQFVFCTAPIHGTLLLVIAFADPAEPAAANVYAVNPNFVTWEFATSSDTLHRIKVEETHVTIYVSELG